MQGQMHGAAGLELARQSMYVWPVSNCTGGDEGDTVMLDGSTCMHHCLCLTDIHKGCTQHGSACASFEKHRLNKSSCVCVSLTHTTPHLQLGHKPGSLRRVCSYGMACC